MADLSLRLATVADAPLVLRMFRDLAQHLGQAEAFTASLDDVRRDGFGPAARYETVLAEAKGKPAGLANYYPTYSSFRGLPSLFIDCIFVEDWARGLKAGRALMTHVYGVAKAQSCCRIELKVAADNPARGFYESLGMAPCPDRPYIVQAAVFNRLVEATSAGK